MDILIKGKKKKFLLINPWIYDFSAYCFWAKPLGLLQVAEYLSQFDLDIFFIDCLEIKKIKDYGTGKYEAVEVKKPDVIKDIPFKFKRYGILESEFLYRLKQNAPYDVVLITSIMGYWYPGVQRVTEIIRALFKDIYIILGGIYATLYYEHALINSGADFVYKGRLDERFDKLLEDIGVNVKSRDRKKAYYNLNLYKSLSFAPLITSYGCPYNCSYCASKLIYGNYYRRDINEVFNEIYELYRLNVRDFAFYDDALLVNSEKNIKPLLKMVIEKFSHIRFHTPNGLHARSIDEEIAILFKKANFKTIRLSLETINPTRQKDTGNKVDNIDIVRAVKILQKVGFTKKELGVYLMYGLPDQTIDEIKEGIKFLKELNVRINLAEFSPIPGTKSWDYLVKKRIIDENIDPLLTNNSVYSLYFSGYDPKQIYEMKSDVKNYNAK
jgi:radical SAM superfamily enzyme YgiQ (UPF0313 family)